MKLIKDTIKAMFYMVTIPILIVATGFGIRSAFPFNKPEFKGLTYYQLAEWRYWDFERLEREQRVYRPNAVNWSCFGLEYGIKVPILPVQGFTYVMNAPAGPVHFPGADDGPKGPSPRAGEHTRAVLSEAGYSAAEIDAMYASGAAA